MRSKLYPDIRHLRLPEDGNHLPKHVGVDLERINKIHYYLEHLLIISQWYYKMLGPTIKIDLSLLIYGVSTLQERQNKQQNNIHISAAKLCL
jgi:hypothetical protein